MINSALLLALLALPPAPARYVSDAASLLEDRREQALNERLARYQRVTSNQLIVYVDRALPAGTTIEELGAEAIRTWRVGQAARDNGVILFLFVDEGWSRIEVGYGLEGVLTDARSKRILVDLRDELRAGDYTSAAERGAEQIMATISGPGILQQEPRPPQRVVHDPLPAEPAGAPPPLAPIAVILFLAGLVAVIVTTLRRELIAPSTGQLPDFLERWSGGLQPADSSGGLKPAAPPPPPPAASTGSTFTGGGGSGGGGGASDRW